GPPAVLTCLRSDIWHELQFNDKNKFFADIEFLEWSDNRLIEVAANRIKTSLGGTVADAWDRVFSTKEMRQRASIRSYVLKRTMGRPRDVIVFCLKCQEVANEGSHEVVETDDVYEAETRYSQYVYGELDDEMGKQVPQARAYLQALRDLGKTRFTLKEWVETLRSKERELTEAEARRRLGILFDYSIVGVPKRGGAGGGTTLLFNYQD